MGGVSAVCLGVCMVGGWVACCFISTSTVPYHDLLIPFPRSAPSIVYTISGKRVQAELNPSGKQPWTVKFEDNAKVMAVKAADRECGCRCGSFRLVCKVDDDTRSVWHGFASAPNIPQVRAVGSLKNNDLVFGGMHLDKNSEWTTAAFSKGPDAGIHNWPQAIGAHLNTDLTTRSICAVDLAGEIDKSCVPPDPRKNPGETWADSCPNSDPKVSIGMVYWWFRMEPGFE